MKCAVYCCTNYRRRARGISFFRFPKNADLRQKWIEAIGRFDYIPAEGSNICEDHFREESIVAGKRKRIFDGEVPVHDFESCNECSNYIVHNINCFKNEVTIDSTIATAVENDSNTGSCNILVNMKENSGMDASIIDKEERSILQGEPSCSNVFTEGYIFRDCGNSDTTLHSNLDENFLNEHSYASKLNEYTKHVVHYIAGSIVCKINKSLKCTECLQALQREFTPLSLAANRKRSALQMPSKSVTDICEKAESILRHRIHLIEKNCSVIKKHHFLKVLNDVQQSFIGKPLFEDHLPHMTQNNNHYRELIKHIAERYLKRRYSFFTNNATEKCSNRQKLSKLVLFKGM